MADNICRCSFESSTVASFCCSRLAHSPVSCGHVSVGVSARLSRPAASLINNVNIEFSWGNHELKSWRYVSSSTKKFSPVVESGMERLCLSSVHRHEAFETSRRFGCSTWLNRTLINGVSNSGWSKCQSNFFGGLAEQRIRASGGENAAVEISDRSSAEQADIQVPSGKDVVNAMELPGVLYPPITTVGKSTNIVWHECTVEKEERQKHLGQKGCVIWITGLSGSGKSTLACALDHALLKRGKLSYVLDGDNVRHGLNNNLGFSADDRAENIRRIGEVAKLFVDAGFICTVSVISPYRKDRDACRQLLKAGEFIEVYMNFPLCLCEERDPKGLYKLARAGKIKGFTGVDDPYEAPLNCEVVMEPIDGKCPTPAEMAAQLVSYLDEVNYLKPTL